MVISVFDRAENILEQGEKAGYLHFSPFPQHVFKKASFQRS